MNKNTKFFNFKQNFEPSFVQKINQAIYQASHKLDLNFDQNKIQLDHPSQDSFGDYSTNIALVAFSQLDKKQSQWQSPRQLAQSLVEQIKAQDLALIKKIEIAGPGFINFWLAKSIFIDSLRQILTKPNDFIQQQLVTNKEVMVEFAHPNTHKLFHIGHLRNICIGESLVRILENIGFKVIRANYQGDVGLHIAKCLYGITQTQDYDKVLAATKNLQDKMTFIGKSYVIGSEAYKNDPAAKQAIHDFNYLIYAAAQKYHYKKHGKKASTTNYLQFVNKNRDKLDLVYDLWLKTRQWSLDFFESIYQRVYTHYDRYFFESECLNGVDLAKQALKKGVLDESEGAIVFKGEKYGLDTRVFINSLGLPTYEGKELALANIQFNDYPNLEKIIHVVAPEQTSFFEVTFKVEELLDEEKFKGKQYHKKYAFVNLKSGKMSSRTGQIITGKWLLDEAKKQISNQYTDLDDQKAETIAVAAVKYSFLKVNTNQEIAFDFKESVNLEGNSGPYLQYAYARIQSLIAKANQAGLELDLKSIKTDINLHHSALSLLKLLAQIEEVTVKAALELEPQYIATYLFKLAQNFSVFYNHCPIVKETDKVKANFRLALAVAVANILKKGLDLLGIKTVEKM